jgi:hypothetical protein
MCLIYIDESTTHVDCCTVVTSSLYLFLKKLNNLLDRPGNRRTMHDYRSDALKWVSGSRKYIHYCSVRDASWAINIPFVLH